MYVRFRSPVAACQLARSGKRRGVFTASRPVLSKPSADLWVLDSEGIHAPDKQSLLVDLLLYTLAFVHLFAPSADLHRDLQLMNIPAVHMESVSKPTNKQPNGDAAVGPANLTMSWHSAGRCPDKPVCQSAFSQSSVLRARAAAADDEQQIILASSRFNVVPWVSWL